MTLSDLVKPGGARGRKELAATELDLDRPAGSSCVAADELCSIMFSCCSDWSCCCILVDSYVRLTYEAVSDSRPSTRARSWGTTSSRRLSRSLHASFSWP